MRYEYSVLGLLNYWNRFFVDRERATCCCVGALACSTSAGHRLRTMRKIPSFLRRSHKLKACESSPVLVASSRKSESQAMTGASGRAMGGRHKSLGKIPGCSLVEETEEEEEEEEGGAPRSASPETKQMANPLALFMRECAVVGVASTCRYRSACGSVMFGWRTL